MSRTWPRAQPLGTNQPRVTFDSFRHSQCLQVIQGYLNSGGVPAVAATEKIWALFSVFIFVTSLPRRLLMSLECFANPAVEEEQRMVVLYVHLSTGPDIGEYNAFKSTVNTFI